MPNTKEINIGLNRFENSSALRIFLALILFMIIQVTPVEAEAGDFDTLNPETTIELIVDADAYEDFDLNGAIDKANALAGVDVEQQVDSEDEELTFPEIEGTVTGSYQTMRNYLDETQTDFSVEINRDNLLPSSLREINKGFSELTDEIGFWGEPNTENEDWQRIPVSGIVLAVQEDNETSGNPRYIHLLTNTPDGRTVVAIIRLHTYTRFRPVNDNLGLVISDDDASVLWNSSDTLSTNLIEAPTRNIIPGDNIIIDIENVEEQSNTPAGTNWIATSIVNGIPEGTPTAVFDAVDDGQISPDTAVIYAFGGNYIIYNQD